MVSALKKLSANELELLYKAPILVSILIAGADGNIDRKEITEAILSAEKKTTRRSSLIATLFQEIAQDFEDKLKILLQQYPYKSSERNPMIVKELEQLNPLWAKIDPAFADEFYKTLLNISSRIASSSGGILGYNAIGSEESRFIKLEMIKNPSST